LFISSQLYPLYDLLCKETIFYYIEAFDIWSSYGWLDVWCHENSESSYMNTYVYGKHYLQTCSYHLITHYIRVKINNAKLIIPNTQQIKKWPWVFLSISQYFQLHLVLARSVFPVPVLVTILKVFTVLGRNDVFFDTTNISSILQPHPYPYSMA